SPLVGLAKDAGAAREPGPSQMVGWMEIDSVSADGFPDFLFTPSMNGSPAMDGAMRGARAVLLERLIMSASRTFLGAFAANDQHSLADETLPPSWFRVVRNG